MGPCKNPNCHSYGKPHPNCKCYAMADGGEVSHFCLSEKPHDSSCEYFSEGGEVDPSQVEWQPSESEAPKEEINPSEVQWEGSSQEINPSDVQWNNEPSDGGPMEQFKAGLEGAAEGVLGPLAPMLETGLGISTKEAINKRAQDFPTTHGLAETGTLAAGLLTGVGEAGLIAKGAGAIAEAANLGKVGSAVLSGALEASAFQGADEMSKSILGKGDPEAPVSAALLHMGAAGLLGGAGGGIFGAIGAGAEKGLQALKSQKAIDIAEKLLAWLAENGQPIQNMGITGERVASTGILADLMMSHSDNPAYTVLRDYVAKPFIKKGVDYAIDKANPYVTDVIIGCMLKNETSAIPQAVHYATQIAKAAKKTNSAMDAIFKSGSQQLIDGASDKDIKQIEEYMQDGGIETQMKNSMQEQVRNEPSKFAEGGEVQPQSNQGFANAFPEQNLLLNQAKGRISNYLNSLRPHENPTRLPFDKETKNKQQERTYKNAITIAANPLSILNKVQSGKLTPEDMKHFSQMMPEGYRYLSKEMTKKVIKSQMSGEIPPYKKRLAMSLFLGTSLDSTTTPVAVQTIQNMYAAKKPAQQPQQKPKKNTENLSKAANSYLTDDQSVAKRQQSLKV